MIIDGESKNVEYKQEYTKSILKTVCAYANFHDGTIAIGIKDNGTIIGVDNIDVSSATKSGVVVMNAPGGNTVTPGSWCITATVGSA